MAVQQGPLVLAASVACLVACAGDVVIPFVLGLLYPSYNPLKQVVSELGTSKSPVALWINVWWIVFGVLMIVFAVGSRLAVSPAGPAVDVLMLQLIVFGALAGIGAGLFPMDAPGSSASLHGRLHNIVGGVGFLALMFAPAVSLWIFPKSQFPGLYWLIVATQILGLALAALFVASTGAAARGSFLSWTGLWQRLFLLNYYVYLAAVSLKLIAPGG